MSDGRDFLEAKAQEDDIEFFFAMFVDMHGKPCAKLVPASAMDVLMEGAGFAGFAAGPMWQTPADPDMIAVPDPTSYIKVPWRDGLAVVMCDIAVDGAPWPYTPRLVLRRQLARMAEQGLSLKAGVEAEYFLVRRKAGGGIEVADPLDTADFPCYDAKGLYRMYDHLSTVSRYMNKLGFTNYANDHEDANGQFEQNFVYNDALVTADRLVFFRYMVHVLAHEAGMAATFMPKPFAHLTGNGLHSNISVWEGDKPLFEGGEADPRGLGLTPFAYQFIGGLIDHAVSFAAVTCPTVNSYKRIGVAPPNSGATWAPAYVAYGGNNRSQMFRVPEGNRAECRVVDGSANPYLAFTVLAAAGMDGVARGLDPGEPNTENLFALDPADVAKLGIAAMPSTLQQAVDNLRRDPVMRDALGTGPNGDYVDYFCDTKAEEFRAWHSVVSDWEVDRYLTLM
jgi:glutamine synthetase